MTEFLIFYAPFLVLAAAISAAFFIGSRDGSVRGEEE